MSAAEGATWGLVATIKAPAAEILQFAAYHLELGASRLHIYLDAPNPAAHPHLKAHPKIRVFTCDETYWKRRKRKRPGGHQYRQTLNATHAYYRTQVDWLAHIDVDEFLWPREPLGTLLSRLPADAACAQVRPLEALPGPGGRYKAAVPSGPDRETRVREIYPAHGAFLAGGFMSHVTGKVIARTGMKKTQFRIHNLVVDGVSNPGKQELDQVDLCHHHSESFENWLGHYRYRLERGSYRPDLAPNAPRILGGLSKHELLSMIEEEQGEAGLRRFYDEVSAQDPEVYKRLDARGMIKRRELKLEEKRQKHFPDFI